MRQVLQGLFVIAAVHAITSWLVRWLPDAAIVALGLLGGDQAAVDDYWASRDPVSYAGQVARLLKGDLGLTLERSPVADELVRAVGLSAPPLVFGAAIAIVLSLGALATRPPFRRRLAGLADALALLPPFVFPFLIAPVLYASPFASSSSATLVALLVSIAAPLTIMLISMLLGFHDDAEREPFGDGLALNRLTTSSIGRLRRASAWSRVVALSDRLVIAGIVSILLAEPLLGLSGIGTLSVRAVRTADPNLTVAITTCMAVIVVSSGVLRTWLRPASLALSSLRRSRAHSPARAFSSTSSHSTRS